MIDADYFRRVVPFPSAQWPGYIGIWCMDAVVWGRAYSDPTDALSFANAMVGRPVDMFVGMSIQSTTKPPKKNRRNRVVLPAEKRADYAVALKALWLDIDLKGGYFKDTVAALTEVGAWRRAAGLPLPSLLVMTGSGGFHLYWVFDTPVSKAVWEPLAWALRTAATMYFKPRPNPKGGRDLTLDFGLTTDAGRILRLPGSLNHKTKPPNPVFVAHQDRDYTLTELDAALTPHKIAYAPSVTSLPPPKIILGKPSAVFAGIPLNDRLDAGVETYVPTVEDVIAGGCGFIETTDKTGGAGYSQPLWFESLKVAYYLQHGAEVAHDFSNGYVGAKASYTPEETDDKFAEIVHSHANQRYGWPQCRTIQDAGAVECRTCPHLPKGKSPLNFALPSIVAAAVVAATSPIAATPAPAPVAPTTISIDWPPGFQQDVDGIVYTMIEDPKDPDKPPMRANVMPYPILNMWPSRPNDASGQWAITIVVQTTRTDIIEARVTYKDYMDLRKLKDTLGDQGIGLDPAKYIPLVGKLMASFVEKLRTSKNRIEDSYSLGWHTSKADGKRDGFVFNGLLRNGTGNRPVSVIDRGLKDLYTPRGTLDEWKKVAALIFTQHRPCLEAIVCMSLGAPMMGPLGYYGGIFSSWSPESGLQKTMATKVAQSFWGDPKAGLGGLNDTQNFVIQRLGSLGSLPYCMDDLKTADDNRHFAGLVMQGPQGRSRGRMTRAIQSGPILTWENIIIVNSNTSLVRSIGDVITQTVAGANRVLEQRITPNRTGLGMISRTVADMTFAMLDNNFGHAAVPYADFIGGRPDFCKDALLRTREAVYNHVKGTDDDRFHVSMAAAGLVGAAFGNHLGLTEFDLDALSGYMPELIQEQRGERSMSTSDLTSPTAIEHIVADYLTYRGDCTLVTDHVRTTVGKIPAGWTVGRINNQSLRHVHIRVARTDKVMRLSLADFENFVKKDRNIGRNVIVDHVTRALPGVAVKKSDLGQGTSYETHRQTVLEFDLNKYDFFPA